METIIAIIGYVTWEVVMGRFFLQNCIKIKCNTDTINFNKENLAVHSFQIIGNRTEIKCIRQFISYSNKCSPESSICFYF